MLALAYIWMCSLLEALALLAAALTALINDCQNTGGMLHCQTQSRILDTTSNLCLLEIPTRREQRNRQGGREIAKAMLVQGSEWILEQIVQLNCELPCVRVTSVYPYNSAQVLLKQTVTLEKCALSFFTMDTIASVTETLNV